MLVENLAQGLAGTKDTQVQIALAQPLPIKGVQNGHDLLQTKSHLQIPPSGLSVPKKALLELTEQGPNLTLATLKCTSPAPPLV